MPGIVSQAGLGGSHRLCTVDRFFHVISKACILPTAKASRISHQFLEAATEATSLTCASLHKSTLCLQLVPRQ